MAYKSKTDQAAAGRRHYEANRQKMIDRAKAHKDKVRQEQQEIIRAAKDVPCADCEVSYPYYVMQFDHVIGKKLFNVGDFRRLGFSTQRILAEIAKCEVVCANCHMERTHSRSAVEKPGISPAS